MIAILGGLGEQGRAVLDFVIRKTDEFILTTDSNLFDVSLFSDYPNLKERHKHIQSGKLLEGLDIFSDCNSEIVIINCLPYKYILPVTEIAIKNGWNVVDLGGSVGIERAQIKLTEEAIKNGSVVIRSAGLAPGLSSSFASHYSRIFGEDLIGLKIFCGVIPKHPVPPLWYSRVFNEGGLINECCGSVEVIHNGNLIYLPALSEREQVFIPGFGVLEADLTSGSMSTTLDDLDVDYCYYKTLRYLGHYDYLKQNILNQPYPREVLSKMLEPVSPVNPDVAIVHIELETIDGVDAVDYYWEYAHGISAMAQATGYTAAAVALKSKEIDPGVYNMDVFDPKQIGIEVQEVGGESSFSTIPPRY